MTKRNLVLIATCLAVGVPIGCTEENTPLGETKEDASIEEFKRSFDKDLAKISPEAAKAKLSIGKGKFTKCLLDDVLGSALNNDKNKILGEMQTNFQLQCEFFKELDERGSLLFDQIKKERKGPSSFYSFQALEGSDFTAEGSVYESYDIGLFLEIEPCQEFERRWRSMGLPTTDCVKNKANNIADRLGSPEAVSPERTPNEKPSIDSFTERFRRPYAVPPEQMSSEKSALERLDELFRQE